MFKVLVSLLFIAAYSSHVKCNLFHRNGYTIDTNIDLFKSLVTVLNDFILMCYCFDLIFLVNRKTVLAINCARYQIRNILNVFAQSSISAPQYQMILSLDVSQYHMRIRISGCRQYDIDFMRNLENICLNSINISLDLSY